MNWRWIDIQYSLLSSNVLMLPNQTIKATVEAFCHVSSVKITLAGWQQNGMVRCLTLHGQLMHFRLTSMLHNQSLGATELQEDITVSEMKGVMVTD
jgi:hypothetical protein